MLRHLAGADHLACRTALGRVPVVVNLVTTLPFAVRKAQLLLPHRYRLQLVVLLSHTLRLLLHGSGEVTIERILRSDDIHLQVLGAVAAFLALTCALLIRHNDDPWLIFVKDADLVPYG